MPTAMSSTLENLENPLFSYFQIMLKLLLLGGFGPYLQSSIKQRNKFSLELEDPSF